MKLRLPRRRLWRVAIYLGSLWLVVTAIDLILVQVRRAIRPGYQTTRVIAPTLPDGRIDYLAVVDEHFGRGVTPENNAAIPFMRAWGREAISPKQPTNGVTDRLGMEPLPEKGEYVDPFYDFRKARNAPAEQDIQELALTPVAWPVKVGPMSREWVKFYDKQLAMIVEGSRRPRFFVPFYAGTRPETMEEILLCHVLPLEESCRMLLTRGVARLEAGDPAGFREDMLAIHRWTRLLAQTPTLVEYMMAVKIEGAACRMERAAAAGGAMPAADAKALAADLAQLGELPSPADKADHGERLFILDICQWMAHTGPGSVATFMEKITGPNGFKAGAPARLAARFLPIDYDNAMRMMNAYYDGAVVVWRQPTWAARREAIRLWEADGERAAAQNPVSAYLNGNWPVIYLLPRLSHAMEVTESAKAELRLSRVTLALAAYKADHGAYPARLDDLSPAYLPAIPADPFTDTPFIYAPTPDGYRLYSVGPNMKDDGGISQTPADDIPATATQQALTTAPATR